MERENQKRVREGDEEQSMTIYPEKHAKTKDDPINGGSRNSSSSSCKASSSSSSDKDKVKDSQYLALGVFDFPWLKDGIISKLSDEEDWNFEDVFSSSVVPLAVVDDTTAGSSSSSSSSSRQCFYENSDPHQDQKLEEDVLRRPLDQHHDHGLELDTTDEGADCIWSSLLNQPLQQPN